MVNGCVLATAVVGDELDFGIKVDRFVIDSDVDIVVGNCVLLLAVFETVVDADVNCVVISKGVVGLLVVG